MWWSLLVLLAGCDLAFGLNHVDPDAADADGLVAYYPLDTLGTDPMACAPDATGHHHDGVCLPGAPTIVAGQIGNAFAFDGTTAVHIPTTGALAQPTALTFAAWLQLSAAIACPFNRLFGTGLGDSWQVCNDNIMLGYLFDGPAVEVGGLAVGAWHHLAITWDGTTVVTYLDGLGVGQLTLALTFDSGDIVLGTDFDTGVAIDPLTGAIDDVRIYGRALTSDEIHGLATN